MNGQGYQMIYMGGYIARIFETVVRFQKFKLVGIIVDETLPEKEKMEIRKKMTDEGISELVLPDVEKINPDIVFLCGYTKILKSELIDKYIFVNIHAGILPKWRGFNANCWAILNGEKKIGYTIHRVRRELDAGEIYKIVDIQLEDDEGYAEGREKIKDLLCGRLEGIFEGIVSKRIMPVPQKQEEIIYNCRLKATDGDIKDWNRTTTWLYGLKKVFGIAPEGTGVRLWLNEEAYSILDMEPAKEIGISEGIPGSVINKYPDGSVLIKTKDTAVKIKRLMMPNGNVCTAGDILGIGKRL